MFCFPVGRASRLSESSFPVGRASRLSESGFPVGLSETSSRRDACSTGPAPGETSFETDMRIVVCYCRYEPIEPQWEGVSRGASVNDLLDRSVGAKHSGVKCR